MVGKAENQGMCSAAFITLDETVFMRYDAIIRNRFHDRKQESGTTMKNRRWAVRRLAGFLGIGMTLAVTGCGSPQKHAAATEIEPQTKVQAEADGEEPVKLILANNHPDDNCTTAAVEWFAGQVQERTKGRVEITVYNDGELGDVMSSLEQLQYGAIDLVKADVTAMSNYVGEYNALLMPYIYQSDEHFWKVHSGDIGMGILRGKQMKEQKMYGLTYYDGGNRCFYNTKKEIHTPKDMKGMLVRVQESRVMMSMVEAMGAQPMIIPYSEVYSSLQPGGVDAADNSIVNYLGQSHYKAAPYFVEDNHTRSADVLVMSEQTREKLSELDLDLIDDIAEESLDYQKELWAEAERQARAQLEKEGVTITTLTEEELQEFRDICEPIWYSYDNGIYNDLVDRIVAAGK